jgi:hypothetical protein
LFVYVCLFVCLFHSFAAFFYWFNGHHTINAIS